MDRGEKAKPDLEICHAEVGIYKIRWFDSAKEMGKLNIFEISFSNQSGAFYAGTMLQGHVTIELAESMKMRGITLRFEGEAYLMWTESRSGGKTATYSASEKYFSQDHLILGVFSNQGGDSSIELVQGRHVFPFQFLLPPDLPSSFESKSVVCGYVRYTVKCTIDKPWKFDHSTKRPFTVISILDLNQQPNCLERINGSKEKFLCCLCCKSGPIQATFHIDRAGYVPGEAIQLNAEISNATSRNMDKSYVSLTMVTTFHSTIKSRKTYQEVARVTRQEIKPHGHDVWSREQLVVPPLPPSFLTGCKIIDIDYVLQLNVDPSGVGFDLKVPLKIIIGTIPLISVVRQYPPLPPLGFDSSQPSAMAAHGALYPSAPPSGIPDMPPPSYSECITGRVNIRGEGDNEHTKGNLDYAPVYTYYNWGHTPGAMPEQKKEED